MVVDVVVVVVVVVAPNGSSCSISCGVSCGHLAEQNAKPDKSTLSASRRNLPCMVVDVVTETCHYA